ncbi:aspartyl-phosphate phosphatase Spo0E family protein [Brevibacillus migulae]|uniref:aspartyl-phosphate phosphatase Spo0E family protein n=1 Tax=Brevibacillus migulae TaxID=1644114 RepID=UPI00106DE4C3|nr:aspartyl-phosphate phosphatase Spo0E family protein [Brevibacillus migulae]
MLWSLRNKIKALQTQLDLLVEEKGSFSDNEVLSVSQELDKLIVEYIKLTHGNNYPIREKSLNGIQ